MSCHSERSYWDATKSAIDTRAGTLACTALIEGACPINFSSTKNDKLEISNPYNGHPLSYYKYLPFSLVFHVHFSFSRMLLLQLFTPKCINTIARPWVLSTHLLAYRPAPLCPRHLEKCGWETWTSFSMSTIGCKGRVKPASSLGN